MKRKTPKSDKPKPKTGNGKHAKPPRPHIDHVLDQLHRAGKML